MPELEEQATPVFINEEESVPELVEQIMQADLHDAYEEETIPELEIIDIPNNNGFIDLEQEQLAQQRASAYEEAINDDSDPLLQLDGLETPTTVNEEPKAKKTKPTKGRNEKCSIKADLT